MSQRQLRMRRPDLLNLPELVLPVGYTLHTGQEDSKEVWEDIILSSFHWESKFERALNQPNCGPDHCWFCAIEGVDVATATSYTTDKYPGDAVLHMVGTHEKGQGKGAGKLAVLAVLHELRDAGIRAVWLDTDDFRLPAIALYLSLGFEPVIDDAEMQERWDAVRANLK